MDSMHNISDAGLYTNFNGLTKLRAEASADSDKAAKEVAKQFESLFLQMMLKSMRDASVPGGSTGESTESDQTRFYQEMFDKQIVLDLANNNNGNGIGLASMLEKEITGSQIAGSVTPPASADLELIRNQINRSSSSIQKQQGSGQE